MEARDVRQDEIGKRRHSLPRNATELADADRHGSSVRRKLLHRREGRYDRGRPAQAPAVVREEARPTHKIYDAQSAQEAPRPARR